jgi:hypothetical protein
MSRDEVADLIADLIPALHRGWPDAGPAIMRLESLVRELRSGEGGWPQ